MHQNSSSASSKRKWYKEWRIDWSYLTRCSTITRHGIFIWNFTTWIMNVLIQRTMLDIGSEKKRFVNCRAARTTRRFFLVSLNMLNLCLSRKTFVYIYFRLYGWRLNRCLKLRKFFITKTLLLWRKLRTIFTSSFVLDTTQMPLTLSC